MKIDFRQVLINLTGTPVKGPDEKAVTLGDVAIVALDGPPARRDPRTGQSVPSEEIDGKEKHRRGYLQERIFRAKEPLELDVEEIKLIKEMIGKAQGPRIVYQAWEMLEGRERPEPQEKIPSGK